MKTYRMLTVVTTAVLIGLSNVPATQAEETTPISFRLDWSIYGSHAPFYLAQQNGLYEDAGLKVDIGEGQGSATVAKLIAQGDDQIGFVDFGTMARAVEQGMPLKAVARVISDVMCIISYADAPIKSPKGLAGKSIAFSPAESTGQVFPALLASQDVDPKAVTVVAPAVGAKNAMLLQKRVQAIPGNYNVQVAQLEAKGAKVTYFPLSDYGIHQMNNGLVTNESFIEEHPQQLRAFIAATRQAWTMAEKDPEAAIDALIKAVPQQARNRDQLLRQLTLTFQSLTTANTEDKPFGWMSDKDWQATQQILTEYGGMPRSLPVSNFYTNKFLSE